MVLIQVSGCRICYKCFENLNEIINVRLLCVGYKRVCMYGISAVILGHNIIEKIHYKIYTQYRKQLQNLLVYQYWQNYMRSGQVVL